MVSVGLPCEQRAACFARLAFPLLRLRDGVCGELKELVGIVVERKRCRL